LTSVAGFVRGWLIDPKTRTATVYTGPEQLSFIDHDGAVSGGAVLPGFNLWLTELFARAESPLESRFSRNLRPFRLKQGLQPSAAGIGPTPLDFRLLLS